MAAREREDTTSSTNSYQSPTGTFPATEEYELTVRTEEEGPVDANTASEAEIVRAVSRHISALSLSTNQRRMSYIQLSRAEGELQPSTVAARIVQMRQQALFSNGEDLRWRLGFERKWQNDVLAEALSV